MADNLEIIIYILTALAYAINEFRKEREKRTKQKPNPAIFEKSHESDGKIYPILWRMLIEFQAARIYIIQFHNGDKFYSGQSIQRYSISHEVYIPNLQPIRKNYTMIPITYRMHDIINRLKLTGLISVTNIGELPDDDVHKDFMNLHETIALHKFHIMDSQMRTIGILTLHFNKPTVLGDIEILAIETQVNEIRNILLN